MVTTLLCLWKVVPPLTIPHSIREGFLFPLSASDSSGWKLPEPYAVWGLWPQAKGSSDT